MGAELMLLLGAFIVCAAIDVFFTVHEQHRRSNAAKFTVDLAETMQDIKVSEQFFKNSSKRLTARVAELVEQSQIMQNRIQDLERRTPKIEKREKMQEVSDWSQYSFFGEDYVANQDENHSSTETYINDDQSLILFDHKMEGGPVYTSTLAPGLK